ncbi:Vacuolar protein sorting-associated protein 62 [Aspergillus nanangensis]|uniref:Vacuolar protein sorting-associated protein 62 n=1 Tax=Aspergillus nanangensis TaxID=2582783 RepID=A0AAD4CB23_ASPNN|nr:Vacuolar protein sorting-associated protein 62 [Aspergillus nanangensis]
MRGPESTGPSSPMGNMASPPPLPGVKAWLPSARYLLFTLFLLIPGSLAAPWSHELRTSLPQLPFDNPLPPTTTTTPTALFPSGSGASGGVVQNSLAPVPTAPDELELARHRQAISNSSDLAPQLNFGQQMVQKASAAIVILTSLIAYVSVNSLVRSVNPSAFVWFDEDRDEPSWVASSQSWVDRKACRWLGLCGTAHFRPVSPRFGHRRPNNITDDDDNKNNNDTTTTSWQAFWETTGTEPPSHDNEIPDYVFDYAPLVHLFSGEQYWPGDIAEHIFHTTPMLNYTPTQSESQHPTLQNLDDLNEWQNGRFVFLTSNDNVEDRPSWMEGEKNVPDFPDDDLEPSEGRIDGDIPDDPLEDRAQWYDTDHVSSDPDSDHLTPGALGYLRPEDLNTERIHDELRKRFGGKPIHVTEMGGRSDAPAVLLVMDKGNGIVDAFWFYFYSFNLGNAVLNVRFGNHIGDWEHCLVRFHHGKPKALFFSAHSAGEAYSYEAVEKIGKRPVIYSASGSHAMYATPGVHDYLLPWGLLHDQTDRGPLWDPLLNSHSYTYDYDNDILRPSTASPNSPTGWFYYKGHWGDKFYPLGDTRQYRFAGQYHYVNGPIGPRFKHLNRRKICQGPDTSPCVIKNYIWEKKRAQRWANSGPGERHDT